MAQDVAELHNVLGVYKTTSCTCKHFSSKLYKVSTIFFLSEICKS